MEYFAVVHLNLKEIIRIFSRIKVTESGCWQWTGYLDKGGYARVRFKGLGGVPVHRLVYAWAVGPIPRGQGKDIPNLDHVVCDNEGCCNPLHLSLALPRDNTLRGNGLTAQNARKVYCKNGHILPTEFNNRRRNRRVCAECQQGVAKKRKEQRENDPEYADRMRRYWRDYDIKRGKIKQ